MRTERNPLPIGFDTVWSMRHGPCIGPTFSGGRVIVLHGPNPATLYTPPSRKERTNVLVDERTSISSHLTRDPAYCVLNRCRLLYTDRTGDVVASKAFSAAWTAKRYPQWRERIFMALDEYAERGSAASLPRIKEEVPSLYWFAFDRFVFTKQGARSLESGYRTPKGR